MLSKNGNSSKEGIIHVIQLTVVLELSDMVFTVILDILDKVSEEETCH